MTMVGTLLVILSGVAMLVFGIQILILAFKTSIGWGLASLLVPFVVLVFVVKYWQQARTPFLRSLACIPVQIIGSGLMLWGTITATTP